MKKMHILVLILILLLFTGCEKVPLYKIEGKLSATSSEYGTVGYNYITVSGDYSEAGLIKICEQEFVDLQERNRVYFFEPNTPRHEENHKEEGMPDRAYSIAFFLVDKEGNVKRID